MENNKEEGRITEEELKKDVDDIEIKDDEQKTIMTKRKINSKIILY